MSVRASDRYIPINVRSVGIRPGCPGGKPCLALRFLLLGVKRRAAGVGPNSQTVSERWGVAVTKSFSFDGIRPVWHDAHCHRF